MDINNLNLSNKQLKIGNVFTPVQWGIFAIERLDLFKKWLNGASVFDPTMGEGNLLEAFIDYGISKGYKPDELPYHRLYGNEINSEYHKNAILKFKEKYKLDLSDNFTNEDILDINIQSFDILFGNPPWANFVDLPDTYKQKIKTFFISYELVGNVRQLLLGGSRIDIASLVIQKSICKHLKENGEAVFFVPLSIFLNDGANNYFRRYQIKDIHYSLECIYDLNDCSVFQNISTRYGIAHFVKNKITQYPIPYFIHEKNKWSKYLARPVHHITDPLRIHTKNETADIEPIILPKESVPRQGINTCGANHIFFFDEVISINEDDLLVRNNFVQEIVLPKKFIFPLITSKNFTEGKTKPSKWVLLPYHSNGKILDWQEIEQYPALMQYLLQHKLNLQNRKGTLLQSQIKRGYWWTLLGVGKYSFFPYKIVWEAYGKNKFEPKIFDGYWQANQSLQAYIPVKKYNEATDILSQLQNKNIEKYLQSMKMDGTMNWAQPGKIKKLIKFMDEPLRLF
ncbi:MAG: hypothetical protein Fur0023_19550 [Bacteroidia bacterium]